MFARNLRNIGNAATLMAGCLVGCSDSSTDVAVPDNGAAVQSDRNGVKSNDTSNGHSTNIGSVVSSFAEVLKAPAAELLSSALPAVPADAEVLQVPAEEPQNSSLPKVPADEGTAESVAVDNKNTIAADNNNTLNEGVALNPLLPKTEQDFKSPYLSNDIELSFDVAGKKIDISANSKEYQHAWLAKGLKQLCVQGNVQHIELSATNTTLNWQYTQAGSPENKTVSVELLYPGHFQYFDWINATGSLAVSLMGTEGNKAEPNEQIVTLIELSDIARSPVRSYDEFYKRKEAHVKLMPLLYNIDRTPDLLLISGLAAQSRLDSKTTASTELGYYAGFMNAEEKEMLIGAYAALEQLYENTPVYPSKLLRTRP